MLQNILKITGVQELKADIKKNINGGSGVPIAGISTCVSRCEEYCQFDPIDIDDCKYDCRSICYGF